MRVRASTSIANDGTRDLLIRAAEELFAAHGIESVSLREINRVAKQGNTGAVQYHFGNRDGLVRAVIEKHRRDTEPRRHALLDHYEDAGVDDLRPLAAALVLPLAAKLSDTDGGREYLQIVCEFYTRPASFDEIIPNKDPNSSMARWNRLLDPLLPTGQITTLRARYAAVRFALVELGRRAVAPPGRGDRLFISHLVDLVVALLAAQPSEQTCRLITPRR